MIKKIKPIILDQVEKKFKIRLTEQLYFKLLHGNNTFKEYFVRKLDEHVNFKEFQQILFKRSEIFERIEVNYNNKVGNLQTYQIHQHCFIKKLIKTFYACYTFSCSKSPLTDHFDNESLILDDEPDYILKGFTKYKIKQRYLLSYLGKNIVFKIHLNKTTFVRNGLKDFLIQLHEANTFPRPLESLSYVQQVNSKGFRQLYTFSFLHVKRLAKPFKSNCTKPIEYKIRKECEDKHSAEKFNSLIFGNYYSGNNRTYDNLSLGLNLQYFYYKYNWQILENITENCSIRTSSDKCDEFMYYIFANPPLPNDDMIIQLMVPINANYYCQDRPKLELSEYLLKGLSIVNFWFGFTIIQMLFNLHDDVVELFKKTVIIKHKDDNYMIEKDKKVNEEIDQETGKEMDKHEISLIDQTNVKLKKSKNGLINKLFKSAKDDEHDYLINYLNEIYLDNLALKRAMLYRNLQLNNWIYNPLTYANYKGDLDLEFNEIGNDDLIYRKPKLSDNKELSKVKFKDEEIEMNDKGHLEDNQLILRKTNNLDQNQSSDQSKDEFKDELSNHSKNDQTMPINRWTLIKKFFVKKNQIKDEKDEFYNLPISRSYAVTR